MLFLTLMSLGLAAGFLALGDSGSDDGTDGHSLEGTAGDDTIVGGNGDDLLAGGNGNDLLGGLDGSDNLTGGTGNDTEYGHGGDDLLQGEDGSDLIYGEEGDDTLLGGTGLDVLLGGAGDDQLSGNQQQDYLQGDSGQDTLLGGFGGDALHGGAGADSVEGGSGNDLVNGGAIIFNSPVTGENAIDDFRDGHDPRSIGDSYTVIFDDKTADTVNGGDGNDTLIGGADDTLTGGEGQDEFVAGDWLSSDEFATVADFDVDEDMIVYRYNQLGTPPEMAATTTTNSDGTTDVQLYADGEEVLFLANAGENFSIVSHVRTVASPMR